MPFSRERLAPEAGTDVESCRANVSARITGCTLSCDGCQSECTSAAAKAVVDMARCTIGLPRLGIEAALHSSDIGVEVRNRWGAKRTENRIANPREAWSEQYNTMIQNRIDKPIVPRNCAGQWSNPGVGAGRRA
mgnify:CR=1 FL=1